MKPLILRSAGHRLATFRAAYGHIGCRRGAACSAAAQAGAGQAGAGGRHATARRRALAVSAAAASGTLDDGSTSSPTSSGFASLEQLITTQLGGGAPGGNWREVEGCWVLWPPEGSLPRALVHFTGGAFVGAAPQLTYRPLLEALADRGALVVATPYATSFDHLKAADEVGLERLPLLFNATGCYCRWGAFGTCLVASHRCAVRRAEGTCVPTGCLQVYFKFARCLKQLGPTATSLPAYGLGHSLGSLMQLLLCSRYLLGRAGNVLMASNNRPATDRCSVVGMETLCCRCCCCCMAGTGLRIARSERAPACSKHRLKNLVAFRLAPLPCSIPLLSPYIAPSIKAVGPILSQLATSPLRSSVEGWLDILKSTSPSAVKQVG